MWGSARRVQPLSLHANDEIGVVDATCVLEGKETTTRKGFFRQGMTVGDYSFNYQANKLVLGSSKGRDRKATTGIVLLHPIGVGIGRWYYNRLLDELSKQNKGYSLNETFVLVPDLLASGSASEPTMNGTSVQRLPLFRVSDWTQQIVQLMEQTEKDLSKEVEWCIVSNGGCVPIALDIARCYEESDSLSGLKQLVLSATPRLSGLLRDSPPPQKVEKAYKTLTGIVGRLFWWYSLRRDGRFIQQFSERNLAADPANLGKDWTPQCLHTAVSKPNSRYSTFAFLAGALQMDCKPSFEAVKNKTIIDVIVGGDKRRNPARRYVAMNKMCLCKRSVHNSRILPPSAGFGRNARRQLGRRIRGSPTTCSRTGTEEWKSPSVGGDVQLMKMLKGLPKLWLHFCVNKEGSG